MHKHCLTMLLATNILVIAAINENYTALNGFWPHVLTFFGLIAFAVYATTSLMRQRLVLIFYSVFLMFDLGYFWFNEAIFSLIRLNFYQAGELYFDLPISLIQQAFWDYKIPLSSYLVFAALVGNIIFLFVKTTPRLILPLASKPYIELPLVSLVLLLWFANFPMFAHLQSTLFNKEAKNVEQADEQLLEIIRKVTVLKSDQAKKFTPTTRRRKESMGWFEVYKLPDKTVYYSTNCNKIDLNINFFVHYWPKNILDIPKERQKHKFDNVSFKFSQNGVQYKNLCYAEKQHPNYAVVRYRTGQYRKDTKDVWAARLNNN